MIFIFAVMIVLGAGSSYGNDLQDRINDFDKGNTGVLDSIEITGNNSIWNSSQNYYCVSKERGSINNNTKVRYQIKSSFKIYKEGIEYCVYQPGNYGSLKLSWNQIKDREDAFGKKGITKKMYYVLNSSDDTYGHYFGGDINLGTYSVSKKQCAIWMLIDDFLVNYGEETNTYFGMNKGNRGVPRDALGLYNEALSNYNSIEINKPVYIWFMVTFDESLRENGKDTCLWQNLILAGSKSNSTTPGGGGGETPSDSDNTVDINIHKIDKTSGKSLSGVKFQLALNNTYVDSPKTTDTNGNCQFTISTNESRTKKYEIWEKEAPGDYNKGLPRNMRICYYK